MSVSSVRHFTLIFSISHWFFLRPSIPPVSPPAIFADISLQQLLHPHFQNQMFSTLQLPVWVCCCRGNRGHCPVTAKSLTLDGPRHTPPPPPRTAAVWPEGETDEDWINVDQMINLIISSCYILNVDVCSVSSQILESVKRTFYCWGSPAEHQIKLFTHTSHSKSSTNHQWLMLKQSSG